MINFKPFIGKTVEITWNTGHVGVSKIISEDDDDCVTTAEYLPCNVFTRATKKHKSHILIVKPLVMH